MKNADLITFTDPKSPVSEVYRTLRTNIRFMSFQKNIKTIVITSTSPKEGKTTITANLGITMAQAGSKVVILDCDLRNPSMHKKFSVSNRIGLTNILVEDIVYAQCLTETDIKNLDLMLCGPKPPNPSEMLCSEKMKNLLDEIRNDYDYILIDTPPVIAVTDAALLASICDGTILVISSGRSEIESAVKAKESLVNVGANIIGAVNNKVKVNNYPEYYRYGYRDSNYSKTSKKHIIAKRGTMNV